LWRGLPTTPRGPTEGLQLLLAKETFGQTLGTVGKPLIRVEQQALALSPDCKTLATGSMDGSIHLCDTAAGKELRSLGNIGGGIIFAPDGKTFIARGQQNSIDFFDLATGKKLPK
jgi:WD40 repeat protein